MLNINTFNNKDPKTFPNYRYQMIKMEINHTGKGKNKITTITNLNDVCKNIGHPPEIVIKALAGKGSRYDSNKMFIKGTISYDELEMKLYDYILNFVLCQNEPQIMITTNKNKGEKCLKPETELYIEDGKIISKCNICSGKTILSFDDKLKKSILNEIGKYISNNGNIKKKINIHIKETNFQNLF